jgi:hypothetical protein
VFHLSQSLWPNLGLPLLALGLIGLAAPLIAPSERRMPLMLIASFAVFWYAVHEASPLKPYPDFARHMLPLAPLLAILATSFIYELLARRDRLGIVAAVTVIVGAIPAPWISMRTNGAVEDPRAIIPPSSPPRAPGWQPIATPTTIRPGSFSATVCGRRSRRPISW